MLMMNGVLHSFSLPAVSSIGFLLSLLYFMYAIAGMALFGEVKRGNFLDAYGNFESFPLAVVTLFRMTTGENWNGLMRDCMVQPPFCSDVEGNCGSVGQVAPLCHTMPYTY
jgi:hypothetical protein